MPHPNPMFDYLTGFVPRRLKDLIRWAEYIGINNGHIYGVVRKFGEYPITGFTYTTSSEDDRKNHETVFEKNLGLRAFLTLVSFDVWITGNSFVSVYEPFVRWLICPKCQTRENINAAKYDFNLDKLEFKLTCRECATRGVAGVKDVPLRNSKRLRLIRWDPKLMDIDANPITGEKHYYWTVPRELIAKVRAGNRIAIDHMPMEVLDAMRGRDKAFRFDENALYHMAMPSTAGQQSEWGTPPITSAIKMVLFAAILRRANEAIALEYITPFRIVHPMGAANGIANPMDVLNMDKHRAEFDQNYRMYRRDLLRYMYSPIPMGVTTMGGDGRALLTVGELQEAEKNIVLSLGVPLEFLTGGLGQTRGEITLRMIENQLATHIGALNGLVEWIESRVAAFLAIKQLAMKLKPFKMLDDSEAKGIMLELWRAGVISDTTLAESIDHDVHEERKIRRQETLDKAKTEQETSLALKRQEQSLSRTVQQTALSAQSGGALNEQEMLQEASQMAQELSQMDDSRRRPQLERLERDNLLKYCAVRYLLDQINEQMLAAQKAEMAQPASG